MSVKLSKRLAEIVDALPLEPGMRILEIGCGSGAMARELTRRIGKGYVLGIDRSAKSIVQARESSQKEIDAGALFFRQVAVEKFVCSDSEVPYDLAVAVRVGALDGRHPELEEIALRHIARALAPHGRLFIDGGNPIKEIPLDQFR